MPDLLKALQTRLITSEQLVEMYLARIAAYDDAGPRLNAFLTLNPNALAEARALDAARHPGIARSPLYGIPVLLKDNVDTADLPTTAGSVALAGSIPPDDAFITRKLREAGAIILGKATLTEFANFLTNGMPTGYSSLGGYGFNPYDPRELPGGDGRPVLATGGSSSGSGIAVSANLVAVAVGTETSGSILSPASGNMAVGIKPTVGLISRDGIIPITADQDTAGPITRTVTDAAILLGVLAGHDPTDAATDACLTPGNCFSDYTRFLDKKALKGARIAVPPFPANSRRHHERGDRRAPGPGRVCGDRSGAGSPAARLPLERLPAGRTLAAARLRERVVLWLQARPQRVSRDAWAGFNGALAVGGHRVQLGQCRGGVKVPARSSRSCRIRSTFRRAVPIRRSTPASRAQDIVLSRGALDSVYNGADGQQGTADDFDALLFSANNGAGTPAKAGYPSITVPGGFVPPAPPIDNPFPSGVTFSGRAFSEPRLIGLAYAYEQATRHRQPPASAPPLPTDTVRRP